MRNCDLGRKKSLILGAARPEPAGWGGLRPRRSQIMDHQRARLAYVCSVIGQFETQRAQRTQTGRRGALGLFFSLLFSFLSAFSALSAFQITRATTYHCKSRR